MWETTPSGLLYPAELAYRPTRWLLPDRDNPSVFRLQDDADPVWGVPLWPGKWIVHVARARSRYPAMSGLGPTIMWGYLFKRYGLTGWVSYVEKYGSPFRMGKYPRGTPQPDIDALGEQLENLGTDAWAAFPDDMGIDLKSDGGVRTGGDVYERLIDYLDRQVSKLVLGQTLTTEAGATGTQALGTVHNEVRRDIRDGDAAELAGTLTRDLVEVMYRANFGAGAVPQWVFHTEPPTDTKAQAEAQEARARVLAAARALGVTLSVEQVRRDLDVQPPEGDQDALATAVPAVPTLAGAWVGGVWSAFAGAEPVPMARLETLIAISTQDLRSAWSAVMDQVRMGVAGAADAAELRARIVDVLRTIDLDPYTTTLTTSTLRAEALGRIAVRPRDEQVALPRTSPIADVESWATATGMTPEAWRARVVEHQQRAQDTTRYAMLRSLQDVLARVDAAPAGGEQETLGAAIDSEMVSPQRTDAVVDAAASVAHGDGQLAAVRATGGTLYLRYNTQRDDRVRPAHRAMEGRVYAATDTIWQTWRPPNGYGCRCYLTVHTADEVRAAGWQVATAVATVDGEPARPDGGWGVDTKAYDWSTFPTEWKAELDKAKADREAARSARGTP
jgi:SPP1 gp7 family putative phage head morphogenesis protein